MKWVLIVIAMNGAVSTAEFNSEDACKQAALSIRIAAIGASLSKEGFVSPAADVCVPKGGES